VDERKRQRRMSKIVRKEEVEEDLRCWSVFPSKSRRHRRCSSQEENRAATCTGVAVCVTSQSQKEKGERRETEDRDGQREREKERH
jgi:hypothetical protein